MFEDTKYILKTLKRSIKNRPSVLNSRNKEINMLNRAMKIARHAMQGTRGNREAYLNGADQGPLRDGWDNTEKTNTQLIYSDWKTVTNRSEQMFRTNPYAKAAENVLLDHCVGEGLKPYAAVKNQNGELVNNVNKQLNSDWERFNEESIRGTNVEYTTSEYYQRLALSSIIRTGSVLVANVPSKKNSMLPVAVQLLKPQRLNWDNDTYFNYNHNKSSEYHNHTIHGMKLNNYGEVDYYNIDENKKVYSDQMSIFFMQNEIEQYLAFPWLAPVINYLYDIDDLMQDRIFASRMVEKLGLWVKSNNKDDFLNNTNDDDRVDWSRGSIMFTKDKPEVIQSNDKTAETFAPLTRLYLHCIAACLNFSYIQLTRDLDRVNFASTRFNSVSDKKSFETLFHWFKKTFPTHMWNLFVEQEFIYNRMPGAYNSTQYKNNAWKYNQVYFLPSGMDWVDPLKDNQALALAHSNGWMTLQEICALKGKDWKTVLRQYKEEKKFLKEHGLDEFIAKPEGESLLKSITENKTEDDEEEMEKKYMDINFENLI